MNNTIAKIVSVCFHPLIVFSLLYIGLLQQTRSYWQIQNNTLYANTLTITLAIISIGVIFILYKLKLISTITLENRKDRIWGFSCFMIMLILLLFLFPKNLATHIILIINLLWALETILLITLFWKISAHLFFWGIAVGFCYNHPSFLNINPLLFFPLCLFLAGIIATARLQLNSHKPLQVYVGFILGFCHTCLLSYLLF